MLRKANSLNLLASTSKSNIVSSKISGSGLNITFVPCPSESPILVKSHKIFPLEYFCCHTCPSLVTVTSQYSDNALTTEAPTPWRPPDTLYPPPPNFPPACNTVIITSTVDFPILGWIPTGIPLPSSITVIELSSFIETSIFLQNPANASSILLSTISYTKWWSPLELVLPMYIPGLFLTASKPSKTWIWLSS